MTPLQPAGGTPPLAEKLSALVARTQRPAAPVEDPASTVLPALTEIAAELRGDLMGELGDLRAEVAAVGDEATEASGRINGRASEIATALEEESGRADQRAAGVHERLDALEAKVDAFALDLSAALRTGGARLEAAVLAAVEEAALVLAETLLTATATAATPAAPATGPAAAPPVPATAGVAVPVATVAAEVVEDVPAAPDAVDPSDEIADGAPSAEEPEATAPVPDPAEDAEAADDETLAEAAVHDHEPAAPELDAVATSTDAAPLPATATTGPRPAASAPLLPERKGLFGRARR